MSAAPTYYGKCGACGVKRADPLTETCASCGEAYRTSNELNAPGQSRCRACGAEIFFIRAAKSGKNIPVNTARVVITTKDGHTVSGYVSHFATCPKASSFRKQRGNA